MFKKEIVVPPLSKVVGWKEHYDNSEIPAFTDTDLSISESGEFYQEKHPAMRLDLIQSTLPNNRELEEYLKEVEEGAITELLNDITVEKQIGKVGKEIVANDVIYNASGFIGDTVISESRFVGVKFVPTQRIGLKATINRIALQFTMPQTDLKIYLYHSHRTEPVKEFLFNSTKGGDFTWMEIAQDLMGDDADLSGGMFYLGYYQDDIDGVAVKYSKLNWRTGFCATCDGGVARKRYSTLNQYVGMQAFYVPNAGLELNRELFNIKAVIDTDTNNWGFNFNISAKCDLTNFWIDNRLSLKNALSLKVIHRILKDISFSTQINHVEEQLKMMIIRDLEGDKETNYINIVDQYARALRAVRYDHSSLDKVCLPCSVNSGVTYGVM